MSDNGNGNELSRGEELEESRKRLVEQLRARRLRPAYSVDKDGRVQRFAAPVASLARNLGYYDR